MGNIELDFKISHSNEWLIFYIELFCIKSILYDKIINIIIGKQ